MTFQWKANKPRASLSLSLYSLFLLLRCWIRCNKNRSKVLLGEGIDCSTDKQGPHQTFNIRSGPARRVVSLLCLARFYLLHSSSGRRLSLSLSSRCIWPVNLFQLPPIDQEVPVLISIPTFVATTNVTRLHTKPLHWLDYSWVNLVFVPSFEVVLQPLLTSNRVKVQKTLH